MTTPQGPDARAAAGRGAALPPTSVRPQAAAAGAPTTVLAGAGAGARRPPPRPSAPRPTPPRTDDSTRTPARARKARLALKRIDPWSVFVFALIASLLLGIALVAAVAGLYAVLDGLGVQASVNELYDEVTSGDGTAIITSSRVVGGAAVVAAANVVLLTLLATLGSLLYNLCASFTGGIEVTLGEREG